MNAHDIPALTRIRGQLHETLGRLNNRERMILLVGGSLVGLTLLWLLFDWQAKTRKELDVAIPRAAAQLARMQSESAELARLRGVPPVVATDLTQLAKTLESTAVAHGLQVSIRSDGNQILISGKSVNFDSWTPWIAETQRANAVRLTYMDVTQAPEGPQLEARLARI